MLQAHLTSVHPRAATLDACHWQRGISRAAKINYFAYADIGNQNFPQLHSGGLLFWASKGNLQSLVQQLQLTAAAGEGTGALAAVDAQGRTALILAATSDRSAVAQYFLLQTGIDVNAADSKGLTALHVAAAAGHLEVVLILLAAGADSQMHAAGASSVTALHLAAYAGHTAIMLQLLKAGADVNAADAWGRTPLHCAEAGSRAAVELLLQRRWGAHVNAQDSYGATALFVLVDELPNCIDILPLLLCCGADGSLPTSYGLTALDCAARNLQLEVVHCLLAHYGRGLPAAAVVSALQEAKDPEDEDAVGGQRQKAVLWMLHNMLAAPED